MSPSYLRLYTNPSPYLEEILTVSEPANGCYYEGGKPAIRNLYGMSEAGFIVLETPLERSYDVAPVGKPALDEIDLHIVDEEGKRIEGPGRGELCFKNEYVRGYLNLPDKTSKVFVNGIYHSGDLCERDESGMYYILGRNDDMFKINGNRIDPTEIECCIKEITGLTQVHAKGFRQNERSFIVLYYIISQAEKLGIYKNGQLECDLSALRYKLPDYMIPTYYTRLEAFPLNANGKLDKRALLPPEQDAFQGEYKAPENDAERLFCDKMQEVLGLSRVGAEDDFYSIGGDSIGAMKFISACSDAGYEISISDLYDSRTPGKLALSVSKTIIMSAML